jgi:hypothetical protein
MWRYRSSEHVTRSFFFYTLKSTDYYHARMNMYVRRYQIWTNM